MKKFLFTLAAMFMVTSAFAANVMYISPEDFTVTKADIENGTEITIPVRAEFSARVSGWDFQITELPAGMTFTFAEAGADMAVSVKNGRGRDAVVNATLYGAAEPYLHMLATLGEFGYWQDPNGENPTAWVTYGVAKWEAGEYEEMLLMYAVFDENYHGGPIKTTTAVSSGKDTRGGTVEEIGEGSVFYDTEYEFEDPNPTVEKTPVAAPTHEITVNETTVTVVINWPETDGDHVYTGEYTYDRPAYGEADQSYNVEAYTTETETYEESAHDAFVVEVPAQAPVWQEVAAPTHVITMDETTVTVVINWPETTGNQVYTGAYTYERPAYGEADQSYDVEAYTEANYPYSESAHDVFTVEVPAQAPVWQEVAAPTHEITMDETTVTVVINWPETTGNQVYTGAYTYERPAYGEADQSYDVEAYTEADYPYSESAHDVFTVEVPAQALVPVLSSAPIIDFVETTVDEQVVSVEVNVSNCDSYQIYVNDELLRGTVIEASTEMEKVIRVVATNDDDDEEPAYLPNTVEKTYTLNKLTEQQLEKTDAPSIAANAFMGNIYDEQGNLVEEHHGYYQVVVTETEANSALEYRVKYEDGEWSDWMPYTQPENFDVEGSYVVEARAKVEGQDYSDVVSVSFVVTDRTGLDELNGEKAVAGVRYYNLAGQQMQEANGVTIVVTTYTDGSVSAVKVMK